MLKLKLPLPYIALLSGLISMISQIVLIRELIVVFYGNELSLGIILSCWLFWTAIGSWLSAKFSANIKSPISFVSSLLLAIAIISPSTIFIIRNIKNILGIGTGEIIGLFPMLYSCFLTLIPICLLTGFLFALICKIVSENTRDGFEPSPTIPKIIGKIYILEAVGASIGGLTFSYFFISHTSHFNTLIIISLLNLLCAFLLNTGKILKFLASLLVILAVTALSTDKINSLDHYSRQLQWKDFKLLKSIDSTYGNITVLFKDNQYSLYENGLWVFTTGDTLSGEEVSHYCLLSHKNPKKILLIAGGMGGVINELLKYDIKYLDYVELDPAIITVARKTLPKTELSFLENSKVRIFHIDGKLFIKKHIRDKKPKYDIVIINLPGPFTAMLNRFYSAEFFAEIKQVLNPDGIVSFGVNSSENYLSSEQKQFLSCLKETLTLSFKHIKIIPGDFALFLASNNPDQLTYDYTILIKRLKTRNIQTNFVTEYYIPFKMSPERISYMGESLNAPKTTMLNTDFKPIGYFYDMVLWSSRFQSKTADIIKKLSGLKTTHFLIAILVFFIVCFSFLRKRKQTKTLSISIAIMTTGLSEITFQIVVILAFQIIYGYAYYKIGLILTAFMIGLVLGSLYINRRLEKTSFGSFIKTQIAICLYPLILPIIFINLAKADVSILSSGIIETLFTFLPLIAGFIGGVQFPLGNKLCPAETKQAGKTTGLLYGLDLFGSFIGALITGAILIPIIGIIDTCILIAILNFTVLGLLLAA